jgi:hypothetical protein
MKDTGIPIKEKLSQNIQSLIGEIGEKQVLLRLSLLVQQTDWGVFYNLGEAGYDILLMNSRTGEKIRVEVKTRQKLHTTGKNIHLVQYFLTDGEYQACDFMIAYHLDQNGFFIVPKIDLKRASASGRTRWRFTLTLNKQGEHHRGKDQYYNSWHKLHLDFKENAKTLGDLFA